MPSYPIRLLGTPFKPTAARQITLTSAGVAISSPACVLNSVDSPYLYACAGNETYQPLHYAQRVTSQFRQCLFNAMGPEGALAPPANANLIQLTIALSLSESQNGTRFVLTLTSLQSTPSSTLTSVT